MVLKIPETGLQLESSSSTMEALPLQAFAISLSDSVIEDMIECVQNGEGVELSLGNVPSFLYGRSVHKITQIPDLSNLDLYLTNPPESTTKADRMPNPTMSMFMKPNPKRRGPIKTNATTAENKTRLAPPKNSAGLRKPTTGMDADIERLKDSMAQANAEKIENSTMIVNASIGAGTKRGSKASSKNKLLPSAKGALASAITRSVPSSPAMSGVGSPSLAPTLSASQQVAEKAKENRSVIVHELAVMERSFDELQEKWPGDSEAEFKTVLDKVADFDSKLQKYVMKKMYWKELDVFKYDYASPDHRQLAIDNAVRMYDRSRMGASEPAWERLLPKEERGKGKCLSKLQATIAKASAPAPVRTPQITVQDIEESSGTGSGKNGEGELSGVDSKIKKRIGGEPMARSSSQPLATKKKVSEREAQAKRLLSTSKKPNTPRASTPKVAAKVTKEKEKDKPGKFKSQEFVLESDSSSDEASEAPLSTTVPKAKVPVKEREKPVEKAKEKEAPTPAPKAKAKPAPPKEVIKPQVTARPQVVARPLVQKRPREELDDDSSSSSSTPLGKRFKQPREIKALPLPRKMRPSESSSQNSSRSSTSVGGPGFANKNKNTSPTKSSPLASSPPTNASDLEQQAEDRRRERERERGRDRSVTVNGSSGSSIIASRKRKAELDREHDMVDRKEQKRQRLLSAELMDLARRFKVFYTRYEELHNEIIMVDQPPWEKLQLLKDMREKLQDMKDEIYESIPAER